MSPIICIGAALIDELLHVHHDMLLATTNNATATKTAGGVSHNIAHQLGLLGVPVQLISVLGNDGDGQWLRAECESAGVRTDACLVIEGATGKYTGVLDKDGALYTAFLTNTAMHLITPAHLEKHVDLLKTAFYLVTDANMSVETVNWLLQFSRSTGIPLVMEPVSVPPALKFRDADLNGLHLLTPNEDELPALSPQSDYTIESRIRGLFDRGVQHVWLHNGKQGSTLFSREHIVSLHAPSIEVVDCTGAGDGSLSGYLLGKHLGKEDMDCMKIAHSLSAEILQVNGAIATHLTQEKLLKLVHKYYPH